MRTLVYAAAFAMALAIPAQAEDSVTGTIESIDAAERVIVLKDKTEMIVAEDVDLSQLEPGTKVKIYTKLDEDGHAAATKVEAVE